MDTGKGIAARYRWGCLSGQCCRQLCISCVYSECLTGKLRVVFKNAAAATTNANASFFSGGFYLKAKLWSNNNNNCIKSNALSRFVNLCELAAQATSQEANYQTLTQTWTKLTEFPCFYLPWSALLPLGMIIMLTDGLETHPLEYPHWLAAIALSVIWQNSSQAEFCFSNSRFSFNQMMLLINITFDLNNIQQKLESKQTGRLAS